MEIVDVGTGPPVVLVPGVQGRWEWMRPAVRALSQRCRVITFSLADEPTCRAPFDTGRGFWCYVDQVREAMDRRGVAAATVCGVSYGGLVASAFAARHPERVTALVLVSAIPPSWRPDARVRFFLRAPWLLSPLFVISSVRLYREIAAAVPGLLGGLGAAGRHAWLVLTHMLSPGRTARRVTLLAGIDMEGELRGLHIPTLLVTGEPALERVVPVRLTHEYLRIWPHARTATIPRTGHLGLVTRPDVFASEVCGFMDQAGGESPEAAMASNGSRDDTDT